MSSRLADRLAAVRRQRFVGRDDERALFRAALSSAEPPFNVLHVYGPGGVGKTTLLTEFLDLCEQAGVPAWRLDARNIDPAPASFLAALGAAIGAEGASPAEAIAERGGRQVILVDTYELLRPLDAWLREVLLPELSAQVVTVLAGREAPAPAWKTDWQSLVRSINLHNLDPDEARAYLARRRVPPEQHAAVLELTRGHPLALTLVADVIEQRAGRPFQLADAPDVIAALLERFVEKVPGPRHRIALETCALLRVTTEPLLAEVLRDEDAHEMWEWLRGLSFVESGPLGLFPHDLARDALSADLRWRNPDRFADLHARARGYYSRRLNETKGQEQQRVLSDYVFLHRDNPTFKPFLDWGDTGASLPTLPTPEDHPALREMAARHEGEESARLLDHWLDRQPGSFLVIRGMHDEPAGVVAMIRVEEATEEDRAADPAIRRACDWLARSAPLRRGEKATHFRFWMGAEEYQAVSAPQSLIFLKLAQHYLTFPGLAFTFFPVADGDFWAPFCAYVDLFRVPEADWETGGRRYTVFAHDWRAVPPVIWLQILADRELQTSGMAVPATAASSPDAPLLITEEEFAAAVHEALRSFSRPRELRASPLARARVVTQAAGPGATEAERASALQALIRRAAEPLRKTPKGSRWHDALHYAYFEPAPSQERAAERLYVSFSTFRRHLKAGEEHVVDTLWHWETEGPPPES